MLIVGVAVRVCHRLEVREGDILPAILVFLRLSTTAFRESRVADFTVIDQYLSARGLHSLQYYRVSGIRNALISLAMVVSADIEYGVVLTVIPAD